MASRFFKIFLICFLSLTSVQSALAEEIVSGEEFYANPHENLVEPVNYEDLQRMFLNLPGWTYGKLLLSLEINDAGKVDKLEILKRTDDFYNLPLLINFLRLNLRFEKKARKDVLYEVGLCGNVLCRLIIQRVGGPKTPKIKKFFYPYADGYREDKDICGEVIVRFDVNSHGRARNPEFLYANPAGQFEFYIRHELKTLEFEKGEPAKGIELKIRIENLGHCDG